MPVHVASKSAGGEPTVADIFFLTTETRRAQSELSFLPDPAKRDDRAKQGSPPGNVPAPKGHIRQSLLGIIPSVASVPLW